MTRVVTSPYHPMASESKEHINAPEPDIQLGWRVLLRLPKKRFLLWGMIALLSAVTVLSGFTLFLATRESFTPTENMHDAQLFSRDSSMSTMRTGCHFAVKFDHSVIPGKATCFIQHQLSDDYGRITAAWQTGYSLKSHECRRVHAAYHQRPCAEVPYPSERQIKATVAR